MPRLCAFVVGTLLIYSTVGAVAQPVDDKRAADDKVVDAQHQRPL